MSDKTQRTVGAIALALGFAVLYFICLLTALHAVGTDDALYYREQTAAHVLPEAGISEDDLRALDGELASYLAGRENELTLPLESEPDGYTVLTMQVFGELQPAFNEREMAHLEDCRALFALLRKVHRRLIPWAVLLLAGGGYLLRDRRRLRRIAWLSPLMLLVPLGLFAVWAALNFDAAFTAFHRVLFSNDLWLLDPRTDLLIRICPQSMFAHMGLRIALITLAALAAIPALVTLAIKFIPKAKEETTWNNRDMRRASAQKQISFGPGAKR